MFIKPKKYCRNNVVIIIFFIVCFNSMGAHSKGHLEHSVQHLYYSPGNVVLGGLFPIHFYEDGRCGAINPFTGVQNLVSVLFALKQVNEVLEPEIGMKLGLVAMDTCFIADKALENSLHFAENRFDVSPTHVSVGDRQSVNTSFAGRIVGVLGPTASADSVKVATLLKLFKIPQISYFSTSSELSDTNMFPYFLRTVPSDLYQAKAIVSLLRYYQWSYVSLIYEDTSYGKNIAKVLSDLTDKNDVCIGFKRAVSESISSEDLESIASSLLEHSNMNNDIVVLLNARYKLAIRIIRAVNDVVQTSNVRSIQWVSSDGLTGLEIPSDIKGRIDLKIVGVALSNMKLPGFISYFKSFVRKEMDNGNDWLKEYWEFKFNCTFGNNSTLRGNCTGDEEFVGDNEVKEYETLFNARNAVYTYGQALLSAYERFCDDPRERCERFDELLTNGTEFLRYLKNVKDPFNVSFGFINERDGPARYSIMSYRNRSWFAIGNFTGYQGLNWDMPSAQVQEFAAALSTCSAECPGGHIRQQDRADICCWKCAKCRHIDTYVNSSDPYKCTVCPKWHIPSPSGNYCQPIVILSFSYSDPLPIFLCVISTVGILGALFTFTVFLVYRKSPIVKASSIGTSSLLLFGIILSFSFPFVAMAPPSVVSCVFTRIFLGLSYTVGYGAIFAKLFMLSRIFRALRIRNSRKKAPLRRSSMLPVHALMLAFGLIGAHSVFILSWTAIKFPKVLTIDTSNDGVPGRLRVCSDARGLSYIGGLIWSFVIMVACCIFAVRLRKLPKAFNERISILYCTSISVILWTVFVPIYSFSTDNYLRIISMCFSLFFHGALLLLTIFGPKVYIILFKPERNTRESVMGFHSISMSSSTSGLTDAQTQTSNDDS